MKFDDEYDDDDNVNYNADYNDGYVSRSQKKRDSTAAQKTGSSLAALSEGDLKNLDLPEPLVAAILDWKKFPGHEAKRRQMQYIGKLMREMDGAAIQEKLDALLAPSRAEKELLHTVEAFRDTLLTVDETELDAELLQFTTKWPKAPAARLRHLAVTARDEKRKKRPPKASRELFRLLKDIISAAE
ncbi:MAG: hypothetical protein DELT_02833 [Desulfovibrio sp.]